jgi:hypothetical protein
MTLMMTVEQPALRLPSSFVSLAWGVVPLGELLLFFSLLFPLLLMIYEASAFGSGLSHLACYPLLSFAHSYPTN